MGKFRKKPVVIDAVQYDGINESEIEQFVGISYVPGRDFKIRTLEGDMLASVGDWIIKGVNGEFYPCKPDIFEKTYEAVGEGEYAEKKSSAERSDKKGKPLFEILGAMSAADAADGVGNASSKWRITRSNDMVAANLRKKGVEITMGIAGGANLILDLEAQRKIPVLFLVDMEEYKKFEK